MMIAPISYNRCPKPNYNFSNEVSFGKKPSAVDLYKPGDETFNSKNLLQSLLDADYLDARNFLQLAADDFDPNYQDDDGMSLIGAMYHPNRRLGPMREKQFLKYRDEILLRIFDHPKFEPNKCYTDYNGNGRYYIDDAVEFDDIFLATLLYKTGMGVYDEYFDNFETLGRKTKNSNVKYVVSQLPLFIQGATAKNTEEKPASSTLYENEKVKQFRATLPESIPESLDDVGGMLEAKKAIDQFIIKPWSPEIRRELRDNFVQLPNGFLMYGPPGCGKTYLAKVVAKQTGFPMYEIDLSNVGTSAAYQTAKTIRNIFSALEEQYSKNNKPSILFLDEIDSIAASRAGSQTDWKRDDVNALITQLNNASEKGVIVIGATNFLDNVDSAVLRPGRFDKKIKIELPTQEERKDIIQKLTARKKIAVDLYEAADELAALTDGKSPSELNAAVNLACLKAICAKKSYVHREDFISAIRELEYEARKQRVILGFAEKK
ncbi:MAG: ATP-binding protein [bacterium]|nr:ATP-binding protein [bacterium]